MNFIEAVKAMREGGKVTRGLTRDYPGEYYHIMSGQIHYSDGSLLTNTQVISLMEDNDWEVVEDKRTLSDKSFTAYTKPDTTKMYTKKDVKAALKEFIDEICPKFDKWAISEKAKEIFGDELVT